MIICITTMAQDDMVGMERIAYSYEDLPESKLPAGRGSMPGKPLQEVEEDKLISGRGVIP